MYLVDVHEFADNGPGEFRVVQKLVNEPINGHTAI